MADVWPRRRSTRCSTTSDGTAGRFDDRRVAHLGAAAPRGRPEQLPPAAAVLPRRGASRMRRSTSTSSSCRARAAPSRTACAPPAGATHVCYCHSPFRYVWHERRARAGRARRRRCGRRSALAAAPPSARCDRRAARRVTGYIANSRITQERIRRFWGRDAPIVHPPVDVVRFAPSPSPRTSSCSSASSSATSASRSRSRPPQRAGAAHPGRRRRARAAAAAPRASSAPREFLGRVGDDGARGPLRAQRARSSCRASRSSGSRPSRRRPPAGR